MPDLTLDQSLVGVNRQKAQLELNFLATLSSTTYEKVPSLGALDGYRPATTTARTPIFLGATGTVARDVVTARLGLGVQTFDTTAPLNNSTIAKMLLKTSASDPYGGQLLARYTDGFGNQTQGQGLLVYTGEKGNTVPETTMYGWSLEWIQAQQVLAAGNYTPAAGGVTWTANTVEALNAKVNPTNTNAYPYQYNVTTAGTTGATEPVWNTGVGSTTNDGSVVYTRL